MPDGKGPHWWTTNEISTTFPMDNGRVLCVENYDHEYAIVRIGIQSLVIQKQDLRNLLEVALTRLDKDLRWIDRCRETCWASLPEAHHENCPMMNRPR